MPPTKPRERKPCAICGVPEGRCVGFAAIVCKSCSVFYRRSYKLRDVLKCKRTGNCDLNHELRNVCRACRLQACRTLGLRMVGKNLIVQANGYPVDDVDEAPDECVQLPTTSPPSTSRITTPNSSEAAAFNQSPSSTYIDSPLTDLPNVSSLTELRKIVEAYVQYEGAQRLVSSMHQGRPIKDYESVYIDKCKQFEMETATLQLATEMVQRLTLDFVLNPDQQNALLKSVPLQFTIAHKAELTNRVFPQLGDTRVAFFVGYHVDVAALRHFINLPEDFERMKTVAWPLIQKRYEVANRCRQIKPDVVEWCGFLGILLYEELARIGVDNPIVNKKRDTLYAEFNQYLSLSHDSSAVAARIIRIVSFTHEIKEVTVKLSDMYDVLGIFFFNYSEGWINKPLLPVETSSSSSMPTSSTGGNLQL
ncbi:Nuclear receptor [Aphelenchoides fujianensis]|nr:Nuclear receptor [Aphelenchoides fujianensis]